MRDQPPAQIADRRGRRVVRRALLEEDRTRADGQGRQQRGQQQRGILGQTLLGEQLGAEPGDAQRGDDHAQRLHEAQGDRAHHVVPGRTDLPHQAGVQRCTTGAAGATLTGHRGHSCSKASR